MEIMTADEVERASSGEIICGRQDVSINSVSIDSRKVKKGSLFVAFIGKRVDGHNYIEDAFANGASIALVEKDIVSNNGVIIKTSCSLRAMQSIASHYRQKFDIPIVAITGSVGKTTTKEICAAVISSRYKTLKSEGNLNSDIGMPLSVFGLDSSFEAAVFEMGMTNLGEISLMSHIARPYIAVITNIGVSHIEKLSSRDNILKAKMEIENGLMSDGVMILNGDDPLLFSHKNKILHNLVCFGINNEKCEYRAKDIVYGNNYTEFIVVCPFGEFFARINVLGLHNVYNALAAVCVGLSLGLSFEEIAEGLLFFRNPVMRQNIKDYNGITIIEDCYNASPESMRAALNVLGDMKKSFKIAVLSDMLELGEHSIEMHKKIGEFAVKKTDYILCFGTNAKYYIEGAIKAGMKKNRCFHFDDALLCVNKLKEMKGKDKVILFKGSRGMKVEDCMNKYLEGIKDIG